MTRITIERTVATDGDQHYELVLTAGCAADPDDVYTGLASLDDHAAWAGEQQSRAFRILTHEGTRDPLRVGDRFATTGRIPMIRPVWQDRSTVTEADPGRAFAFVTQGVIDWSTARAVDLPPSGRPTGRGTFEHRYELERVDGGCRVTYRFTQTRLEHPPVAVRWAAMRPMTQRVMAPRMMARGLRNLLLGAEAVTASRTPAAA